MDQNKKKKWKKKAAVGMVAAATSASVLVGGAFDSPADLLNPDNNNGDDGSPTPIVETVSLHTAAAAVDDGSSGDEDDGDQERRQRFPAVRRWVQSQPAAVRALVGVPLWCVGWGISSALALLGQAAMTPLGGRILSWILAAVAAVLVFALTAKAIFPNVPLKKLLRPRNVLIVLGGMAALGAADTLLSVFWKDYPPIGQLLRLVGGALMITAACLSTRKLLRRHAKAEEAPEEQPAEPESVLSVEEQAMALANTVCPAPVPRT